MTSPASPFRRSSIDQPLEARNAWGAGCKPTPRLSCSATVGDVSAPKSDAALVEQLSAGDRDEAIRRLYARYGRRLYGFGVQILGDEGMAEELVQETFVRLWRSAGRFDPSRGSVRTFLFTIARRAAIDFRRRPSARPLDTSAGDQHTDGAVTDEEFDRLLLRLDIRDAMSSLSDKHREALELQYERDLTQRQISEQLGVPLGTVKTRAYHAVRALGFELRERGLIG